ncbi:hypothetical protein KI387_001222 [Taxus chinensis]|uniref:Peroxidase n=1 Tax=Taxus chinensis TaxID=29808 RepID=A0AA38GUF9_TAXCH|nr:hypothetical protein KI387_001222 [Taxus chinensis]
MKMKMIIVAALMTMVCVSEGHLVKHFYKESCPSAEHIVKKMVDKHMAADNTLHAPLLRMQFHDCFVRGCDGSVLINSTTNNTAEKAAIPNLTIRGFYVIDDVKEELEKKCPGVVSCADILALVARDAVVKGGGPSWRVRTGRRDGVISRKSEATNNIPQPTFNFSQLQQSFAKKGLSVKHLVVLSGGHTIGIGHCNFVSNRLYNFSGNGTGTDPSIKPSYARLLKTKCTNLQDNTTIVPMDPNTPSKFDRLYFTNLKAKQGLFQSDAALLTNSTAKKYVDKQLNEAKFLRNFKKSMQKLSETQVKTGIAGKIRRHCALVD